MRFPACRRLPALPADGKPQSVVPYVRVPPQPGGDTPAAPEEGGDDEGGSATPAGDDSGTSGGSSTSGGGGLPGWAIALIVVGSVAAAGVLALLAWPCVRSKWQVRRGLHEQPAAASTAVARHPLLLHNSLRRHLPYCAALPLALLQDWRAGRYETYRDSPAGPGGSPGADAAAAHARKGGMAELADLGAAKAAKAAASSPGASAPGGGDPFRIGTRVHSDHLV